MAVSTTSRLGITRWSAGTDPFTRAQMDASHAALDDLVAIDLQGTIAARPAASIRGRYYYATDEGRVYRDTGTGWDLVNGIATLTTTERDALTAAQKWDGRLIYNSTLKLPQRWSADMAAWLSFGSYGAGTLAARPAASAANAGMLYEVTDGRIWSISTGAAWTFLHAISTMDSTQRDALIAGSRFNGRVIYNSTTAQHETWNGTAWVALGGGSSLAMSMLIGGR